mgnify:CR=1 FL=1
MGILLDKQYLFHCRLYRYMTGDTNKVIGRLSFDRGWAHIGEFLWEMHVTPFSGQ